MNSISTAAAVMLLASWTSSVVAGDKQPESLSGTIEFIGTIVESVCMPGVEQQQLRVSCQREGQSAASTVAMTNTRVQALPYHLGSTELRWIDRQHRLGILTVSYQ